MTIDDGFMERFAQRAIAEGLVDGTFASFSSPIGRLTVVTTDKGLCRVAFAEETEEEVLRSAARILGPRLVGSTKELKEVTDRIAAYLEGAEIDLALPIDFTLVRSQFQRNVLTYLQRVPRGQVATYSQLAQRAGNAKAVRATGTALARNPIPIVVPCHRVLPMSGGVGNYGGGPERKRWLLDLEGAPLTAR